MTLALALGVLLAPAPCAWADRVFDPEDPPDTRYRLAPGLTFGAELELDFAFRRNLDLDDRRRDDVGLLTPELSLAWSLDPTPALQAFVNVALSRTAVVIDPARSVRQSEEDFTVELKEAYLRAGRRADGPSIQVGRQRFEDERKWLYDEDLDAARLAYVGHGLSVEASVSRNGVTRTTWGGPDERERINNYILLAGYAPRDWILVEGYAITRPDRTAERSMPVFLGLRSRGEPLEDLDYWLELAHVRGRNDGQRIRGWGIDAGIIYEWQVALRPSLTLAYAFGTGDRDPEDGLDEAYRQTGLHRNEGDLGGSAEFKYYGEILDPELSNLGILTVGIGIRPSDTWSVDLVYHRYVQHRASTSLRSTALAAEPSGRSRRLGDELDLIVGVVDLLDRIDVKAMVGYFFPGAAFPSRSGAWGASVEAQFRF